jgi:hypothetical protein
MMGEFAAGIAGGLIGALIGYLLRGREFRRDQRLRVYGEFMAGLLNVARSGGELQSLCMQLGPPSNLKDENQREAYRAAWAKHDPARAAFDESAARLRLIASSRVRRKALVAEDWVAANVHGVPPFRIDFAPEATAGRVGPRRVQEESVDIARQFADGASHDVAGSIVGRR